MTRFALAAACLVLAFAAQPGSAQDAVAPSPPPVTAVPVAAAPQAPAVTAAPAAQAPPPVVTPPVVTAAPAPKAAATPPVTAAPVVTAAPAPQAVATPPVTAAPVVAAAPAPKIAATPPTTAAPVVVAAPAPKAVATPPVVSPVVIAAPAPKAAAPATPPVTAAPVAKAAPAPAPVAASVAKAAPAPGPSSSSSGAAVLPGLLPFPLASTPAPAPAPVVPPRMCLNGPPKCQLFIEDVLCCGNSGGLATDSKYLKVDVLCTEYVVIPQGCLTVSPLLTNISVSPAFQPAGVASTFHDFLVDFQKDNDFEPGPFVGRVDLTLETLRNVSSPNFNPTCAQAISPCLYNGTLYNQTVAGGPIAITVLDTLDFIEGYIGLPPTPTDTLGWSTNASNPAICAQQDVGSIPPAFYTGGFVNYTGYQNSCNTTRTILDTFQFCEDYTLPYENATLHNLPPSPPVPRVPGPSLGPSSKDGIRL